MVDVNGAQPGSAGHEQVQAWAQQELELGQGSKAGCRGLQRAGWPREQWPQCTSEAEPYVSTFKGTVHSMKPAHT